MIDIDKDEDQPKGKPSYLSLGDYTLHSPVTTLMGKIEEIRINPKEPPLNDTETEQSTVEQAKGDTCP